MMAKTELLAQWIIERENMRLRKEGLQGPRWKYGYSDDPNMGDIRYCNVHREDDKVTKWIAKNWRDFNAEHPNLTLAMVQARMINLPSTLEQLGFPYNVSDLDDQKKVMKEIKGKKWTSAYTISTCGRRMGKEDYVFDHVLRQVADYGTPGDVHVLGFYGLWDSSPTFWNGTLDHAHKLLMNVDGLGSFLAAQVVADLKNTPGHPLGGAPDWWDWSAHGPGSLRGLAAYYGAPVTASMYHRAIAKAYSDVISIVEPIVGRLHMQDFQNCLCEFSKYMRARENRGFARNKYHAR